MKTKNRRTFVFCRNKNLNPKPFSIKIWVEELSSWIVFDNFKTADMAREFLEVENDSIEKYISREIKSNGNKKEKEKASVSNSKDTKKIKK